MPSLLSVSCQVGFVTVTHAAIRGEVFFCPARHCMEYNNKGFESGPGSKYRTCRSTVDPRSTTRVTVLNELTPGYAGKKAEIIKAGKHQVACEIQPKDTVQPLGGGSKFNFEKYWAKKRKGKGRKIIKAKKGSKKVTVTGKKSRKYYRMKMSGKGKGWGKGRGKGKGKGRKGKGRKGQTKSCKVIKGQDIDGKHYKHFKGTSDACRLKCEEEEVCGCYVYVSSDTECWLKSTGECSSVHMSSTSAGMISGTCDDKPVIKNRGQYEYLGRGQCISSETERSPRGDLYAGRAKKCARLCDKSKRCHGYSTTPAPLNNCYLWKEYGLMGGGYRGNCYSKFEVSENKQCPGVYGSDVAGKVLKTEKIFRAGRCEKACEANKKCGGFVFNPDVPECILKSIKSPLKHLADLEGGEVIPGSARMTAGICRMPGQKAAVGTHKKCTFRVGMEGLVKKPAQGEQAKIAEVYASSAHTAEGCKKLCANDKGCGCYTHATESSGPGKCVLKKQCVIATTSFSAGRTSGICLEIATATVQTYGR